MGWAIFIGVVAGLIVGWWGYAEAKVFTTIGAVVGLVGGFVLDHLDDAKDAAELTEQGIRSICSVRLYQTYAECKAELLAGPAGIATFVSYLLMSASIAAGLGFFAHWGKASLVSAGGAAPGAGSNTSQDPITSGQTTSQPRPAPKQPNPTAGWQQPEPPTTPILKQPNPLATSRRPDTPTPTPKQPADSRPRWVDCPSCSRSFAVGEITRANCPYCSFQFRVKGSTSLT